MYPHVNEFSPEHAEQTWAFLGTIIGSSQDAVVSKTLEGMVTSWNAAAERFRLRARSNEIGKKAEGERARDRYGQGAHLRINSTTSNYHGNKLTTSRDNFVQKSISGMSFPSP